MKNNTVLKIENLRKQYGDKIAVDDISFSLKKGEVLGLLGPNGAGKTTTIDIILGLVEPTSGSIIIFEKKFAENRSEILKRVNFAAVYAELPGNLAIQENLLIFAMLYGVPLPKARVGKLLREFDLEAFARTKSGLLSSGEKSRVNLAKALINSPELLLLDEPTASLDPSSSEIIRLRFRDYARAKNAAILWTSHDMREIEAVCDRVLFISHGKILLEGKPKELPMQYGKKNLEELFIAVAREPLSLEES